MNVQLIVAGCLAVVGAGIHGVLGDLLVVRRLSLETLPATRFGGRRATKSMIHVTWELTTLSFLMVGAALLLSGTTLHGDTAHVVGLIAAGASTGFAALVVTLGVLYARSLRSLLRHPAAALLTATAALAWWGVL